MAFAGAPVLVRWPVALRSVCFGALRFNLPQRPILPRTATPRYLSRSTAQRTHRGNENTPPNHQNGFVLMTGTFKCHKNNCPLCQHVVETNIVTSKTSGRTYAIPDYITCDSSNVNYVVECLKCGMQYVGTTGRKIRTRGTEHIYDVHSGQYSAVSEHFNQQGHSVFDLAIIFIQRAIRQKEKRLVHEAELIRLLETLTPDGLNKIMPMIRYEEDTPSDLRPERAKTQTALAPKTKPKMTWLQTTEAKGKDKPTPGLPPKRHFHRQPDGTQTPLEIELLDRTTGRPVAKYGRAARRQSCRDGQRHAGGRVGPRGNEVYFGKVLETLDERRSWSRRRSAKPRDLSAIMGNDDSP